jgi:hypothetical protein
MKTLSGLLLAAALLAVASAASAGDKIEVIVVTAKKPTATLLSDMEDEIFAETAAALRSEQPALAAPAVHIEIPAATAPRG